MTEHIPVYKYNDVDELTNKLLTEEFDYVHRREFVDKLYPLSYDLKTVETFVKDSET